jgi:hypothetical protein
MKNLAVAAAGSSPILTLGAIQFMHPSPADWEAVAVGFLDPRFWFTLGIVLLFGAFGGVSYELLLLKGTIELPHRVDTSAADPAKPHLVSLGIVGRAIVGAAAAGSMLLVNSPTSSQTAVALAITSGIASQALIRLLRKQLVATTSVLSKATRQMSTSADNKGQLVQERAMGRAQSAPAPTLATPSQA